MLIRHTLFPFCILTFCNFSLGFESGTLILISSVPDLCLPFTFHTLGFRLNRSYIGISEFYEAILWMPYVVQALAWM